MNHKDDSQADFEAQALRDRIAGLESQLQSQQSMIERLQSRQSEITDDARCAAAVRQLHASNERFQQFVENIREVFWIASADGQEIVFISPGYETLWGRTCESLYAEPLNWLEAIHEEDRQQVTEEYSQIAESGKFDSTYRVIRPDSTMRWVHDRGFRIRDEEGNLRIAGIAADITAWKQVEEERDRFFTISLDLLCLASLNGYFIRLNPMFEKALGYTNEELMDKPFLGFVHPDDRKKTVQALQALAAGQNVVQFENRYLCKDGTYKWLAWSTPAPLAGESVYYAAARDITQQKEVQKALLESEARFRALVRHAPEAILMLDADSSRFTDANENALKLYRLSREKLLASTPGQLSPPTQPCGRPSPEMAAERIAEALKNKTAVFDWMHRDSRGRDIPCEVRLVRLPGRKRLVRASVLDITARKVAEEALQKSEARYRESVENANDLIFTIDLEGRFQSFNKAARELSGYASEEILNANMSLLLDAENMATVQRMMRHKMMTHKRTNYEIEIRSKCGDRIPVEIHSRLIYENGRPVAIQGIARDITERRKYEEQLRVAKDAAEAASQTKSEFMANMSHEIRTPMNAVIGLTELVLDSQLSSTQREYLSLVLKSANSLMSIINDVLDFSKIESGKIEILPANFELREIIGDTLKSLAWPAHEQGLELAWHVAPGVPDHLVGDATRVRQVLVNLVGNAIKFTKQGQVLVDVKCDTMTDTTAELQFSVADTGIGIPAEKLEAIFDAFEQADTSTTREFGGTGLGLAICKSLVEMMGGRIWAESEEGSGSVFCFHIRFGLSRAANHEHAGLASLAGVPVLVVDDNATSRSILEEMLTNWGFDVRLTLSGQEAVDLITQKHHAGESFQLLITDLHMPQMDGFELCRQIREAAPLADLKIIMLTSGGHEGNEERCHPLRIAQRLLKPVRQSELLGTILEVMGVAGPLGEPTRTTEFVRTGRQTSLRILIAEDGIANQKLAAGLLTAWGHHVTIANNGREAIDQILSSPFDLVLMDVQMPVMDGLEATRHIREYEKERGLHLPIIAMTAHAMPGDREKCLQAGMDDYVSKPVRRQELYAALATLLPKELNAAASDGAESGSPPTDETAAPVAQIDWVYALKNLDGNRQILKEVINASLEEIPEHLTNIRSALNDIDYELIRRESHTIKGCLQIFGETKAWAASKQLEALACAREHEGMKELFAELQREWVSLVPGFAAFE